MKTTAWAWILIWIAFPLYAADPPGTKLELFVELPGTKELLAFSFVVCEASPLKLFGRFEITQQQYRALVPEGEHSPSVLGFLSGTNAADRKPILHVQPLDVVRFCGHLKRRMESDRHLVDWSFRLPSISEWRLAASAGPERVDPFFTYQGDEKPLIFPKIVLGEGTKPLIGGGVTWERGNDDAIVFKTQSLFLKFLDDSQHESKHQQRSLDETARDTVGDQAQKLYLYFLKEYVGLPEAPVDKEGQPLPPPYHEIGKGDNTYNTWGIWDLHGNAREIVLADPDRSNWNSWVVSPGSLRGSLSNKIYQTGNRAEEPKYAEWKRLSSHPQDEEAMSGLGGGLGFRIVAIPKLNPAWNSLVYDQLREDMTAKDRDALVEGVRHETHFLLPDAEQVQLRGMFAVAFIRVGDLDLVEKELREAQEFAPKDEATTEEIDALSDYVQRLKDVKRRSAQAFGGQGL